MLSILCSEWLASDHNWLSDSDVPAAKFFKPILYGHYYKHFYYHSHKNVKA